MAQLRTACVPTFPGIWLLRQQEVVDGMNQPLCSVKSTTVLPLSRQYQQLQPKCSGSQSVTSKPFSPGALPRFQCLLQASDTPPAALCKAAGFSGATVMEGYGQIKGSKLALGVWSS